MEFSYHEVGHCIADHKERRHTDDKVDNIPCKPCLYRHGQSCEQFQISEGMESQVDDSRHGEGTSLKHRIHHIQRKGAEHEHKFKRFCNSCQENGQTG